MSARVRSSSGRGGFSFVGVFIGKPQASFRSDINKHSYCYTSETERESSLFNPRALGYHCKQASQEGNSHFPSPPPFPWSTKRQILKGIPNTALVCIYTKPGNHAHSISVSRFNRETAVKTYIPHPKKNADQCNAMRCDIMQDRVRRHASHFRPFQTTLFRLGKRGVNHNHGQKKAIQKQNSNQPG